MPSFDKFLEGEHCSPAYQQAVGDIHIRSDATKVSMISVGVPVLSADMVRELTPGR
jgi:hypothetical protein